MFFIVLIEFTSNKIDTTFHGLFHLVIFHLSVMQNPSKNVFMLVTKDFPLENLIKRGRCPFFWVHFYVMYSWGWKCLWWRRQVNKMVGTSSQCVF